MLGTEELLRFVQFINGDFLSLCLCRRAHYCSHGLDSRISSQWAQLKFSQCSRYGWMQTYPPKYLLEMRCVQGQSVDLFSFPFGNDFQRDRGPQDCCIQQWGPPHCLCKLKRSFSGAFYPLDLTNQYLDFTKSFFFLKQALQQLTLGSEVAESTNNSCLLFILTAYTMKS